jgi:hypothetical protein
MSETRELLDSLVPEVSLGSTDSASSVLAPIVDALSECEEAVTVCAAAMLAEERFDQRRLAALHDLNCADVLAATRRLLSRATEDTVLLGAQLEACVIACRRSHETCSRHAAHHEHCRLCSEATRRAADACNQALEALRA